MCPPPKSPENNTTKLKIPSELAKKKEAPLIDIDFNGNIVRSKQTIEITEPQLTPSSSNVGFNKNCGRVAKISKCIKSATQSGTHCDNAWQLEFNVKPGWENPLMGWYSSGDPLSSLRIYFRTKLDAITYCQQNCINWFVQDVKIEKKFKPKNYGQNFHYKKRTRVSTK